MAFKEWSTAAGRRPSYRLWAAVVVGFILFLYITPYDRIRSSVDVDKYTYKLPDALRFSDSVKHGVQPQPRIGLVSMSYGNDSSLYDRAIETHARHAARHKYPLFVLRRGLAEGYWSKTQYLISLLIQELAKPEDQRLEWLMWFDADSVSINREIPLEVFLPEKSDPFFQDTHIISGHDQWGMNTGIFFTRVHPKSVTLLFKAVTYPIWRPKEDLGHAYDQKALDLIVCSADFQRYILWAPREFFNSRHEEVVPGTMFAHFYSDVERPQHMREWLEKAESGKDADMQIPYNDSFYPPQVDDFWTTARECRTLLKAGRDSMNSVTDETLRKVYQDNLHILDNACLWKTEAVADLRKILDQVKLATHWA